LTCAQEKGALEKWQKAEKENQIVAAAPSAKKKGARAEVLCVSCGASSKDGCFNFPELDWFSSVSIFGVQDLFCLLF
jgi:hypothetical protein